jgi:MFS family permease
MKKEKRNIYLFTSGKAVSIFGSSIYSFAISLYVLKITGSALSFATTLMLSVIPMILISPIAGVVADRIPKKWLVVGMDLANGLLFALLFLYSTKSALSLPLIYVSTILLNVFTTFFGIGIEAAKPSLVNSENLMQLNSLSKLIDSFVAILGPVIGGVVFALVDLPMFILFNACSFIFSAITEWFIDYHYNSEDTENTPLSIATPRSFKKDLHEGWHFFSTNQSILELFFIFVSLNFLLGFSVNVPAPYIINQLLKLPSSYFGIINGMFPVGLIIGTLTVERVTKKVEFRKLLITMNGFIAILASLIGLPLLLNLSTFSHLLFYSTINIFMGIAIAYVDVPIMTLLQNEIPKQLLGRVLSIIMSLVKVVLPIALITSGLLLNRIPVVVIPLIGASIAFIYSVFLLTQHPQQRL